MHRTFYGKDGLEVYGGAWKAPKWRMIPHTELNGSQVAQEANDIRAESKLNESGMRIAKRTNWIRGRKSTTFQRANVRKPGYARINRMANMRNKNVTKRIGKPRRQTTLTYSFGSNDTFWYLFDPLD